MKLLVAYRIYNLAAPTSMVSNKGELGINLRQQGLKWVFNLLFFKGYILSLAPNFSLFVPIQT